MSAHRPVRTRARALRPLIALIAGFFVILAGVVVVPGTTAPARAEGTGTVFGSSTDTTACATGTSATTDALGTPCRFGIRWESGLTVNSSLYAQTLLSVYAHAGEDILLGSGSMATSTGTSTTGDIYVWNPGVLTDDQIKNKTLIGTKPTNGTNGFVCSTARGSATTSGVIGSRAQELAGPKSADGSANASGYTPCVYKAPADGIYEVAMIPTAGFNKASSVDTTASSYNVGGVASVASKTQVTTWDVRVVGSDSTNPATGAATGRVFSYGLYASTGGDNRYMTGSLYAVTLDGFRYKINLSGISPYNFALFGNEGGFLDASGNPIEHDAVGTSGTDLANVKGGVKNSPPQFPLFFEPPSDAAVGAIPSYMPGGTIPTTAVAPTVSDLRFAGSIDGAVGGTQGGTLGTPGGDVYFTMNEAATYQVIVSKDGTNWDPGDAKNRSIIQVVHGGENSTDDLDHSKPGIQMKVHWDGKANDGTSFAAGNYKVRVILKSGVYHFPLIDAERSLNGGPSFQLINPPNGDTTDCAFPQNAGWGCYTAFYDDRGYATPANGNVGVPAGNLCDSTTDFHNTIGYDPNSAVTPGRPGDAHSDFVNGFNSSSNQRRWGLTPETVNGSGTTFGSTTGVCEKNDAFGNGKGIDTWTYYPSTTIVSSNAVLISPAAKPDDTYATTVGNPIARGTQSVLDNDDDAGTRTDLVVTTVTDKDGSTHAVTSGGTTVETTKGGHVTIYPDGTFSYQPPVNYVSDPKTGDDGDSFAYVSDGTVPVGQGGSAGIPNNGTVTIVVTPGPALSLSVDEIKLLGTGQPDGSNNGFPGAGDHVQTTYTVANVGSEAISNITIDSALVPAGLNAADCTVTGGITNADHSVNLAVGASATFVCDVGGLTAAQVENAKVTETATAHGSYVDGPTSTPVTSQQATRSLVILPHVGLSISHAVTRGTDPVADASTSRPGDTVTYTYIATNIGSVALDALTLTPTVGDAGALTYSTDGGTTWAPVPADGVDGVAVGASVRFRASHTVTAADILDAPLTESATVDAVDAVGDGKHATATATDALAITKAAALSVTSVTGAVTSAQPTTQAGDEVTFTYTVTNTGNIPVTGVTVNPVKGGSVHCSPTTLAPGASATCTATYDLTQTDVDAASVSESATASGDWTDGDGAHTVTSPSGGTSVALTVQPVLDVAVTGALSTASGVNPATSDHITYTYTVTNSGDVTVTGIGLAPTQADGTPTVKTGSKASLAPGASVVLTATHQLTATDLTDLSVTESVLATGTYAAATVTSDADPATAGNQPATFTNDLANPAIDAQITGATSDDVNSDGMMSAGETVTFDYLIANAGNVPLSTVTADGLPGTCTPSLPSSFATGATRTFSCAVTLTQADIEAGTVSAAFTAGAVRGAVHVSADATLAQPILRKPAITTGVALGAAPSGAAHAGDLVDVTYTVTNTGNVAVTGLAVTPTLAVTFDPDDVTGLAAVTLAPGAHTTITGSHALTQSEVDAARVDESASSAGTWGTASTAVTSPAGTDHATLSVAPALDLALAQSYHQAGSKSAAGDTIDYTYTVTNTGDVTITGVALAGLTQAVGTEAPTRTSGLTTLAPGATVVFSATHTITAADIAAGTITETAEAAGSYGTDPVQADADPTTAGIQRTATVTRTLALPELSATVSTTSTALTGVAAGQAVPFTYTVTNTGNVTVTGITFSGIAPAGCTATLAITLTPGQSLTAVHAPVTCSYALTQADVDAGSVTAAVTASGTYGGASVTSTATPVTVTLAATPALSVTPSATTVDAHGAVLTTVLPTPDDGERFRYTVTNSGTVMVSGIGVAAGSTMLAADCSTASTGATCTTTGGVSTVTLAPGASVVYGYDADLAQSDIDAGTISQTVSVTGTPSQGSLAAVPATASNTLAQEHGIDLLLTGGLTDVNGNGTADENDTLDFTYLLTNTGNTTLHGVHVDDATHGLALSPTGASTLAPGDTATLTASRPVTTADVAGVMVTEKATALATAPGGTADAVRSPERSLDVTLAAPSLSAALSGALVDANHNGRVDAGDTVVWSYTQNNTGNVDLTAVSIGGSTAPTLVRGHAVTYQRTQALTQVDIDHGSVDESAQATTTFAGQRVASSMVSAQVPLPSSPGLSIAVGMTADPGSNHLVDAGDTVKLTYTVTNNGASTVDGVSVAPTLGTSPVAPSSTTLAPGDVRTWTATYVLTAADLKAGSVTATASASGHPATGPASVTSNRGTATMPLYVPGLTITVDEVKVTSPSVTDAVDTGDSIEITITVTNTGGTTITGIDVSALAGDDAPAPFTLAPGQSVTITIVHHITGKDLAHGGVSGQIGASGQSPAGTVVSTPVKVFTKLPPPIKLALTATLITQDDVKVVKPGDKVRVSYLVRNVGGFRVTHVMVVSDLAPIAGVTGISHRTVAGRTAVGQGTLARPAADRDALANVELRVGGQATYITEPYTVTDKDLARGRIVTSAIARGMRAQAMTTVASNVAQVDVRVVAPTTGNGTGELPNTGSPRGTWQLALLGLLMVGAGAALTRGSRRRSPGKHRD